MSRNRSRKRRDLAEVAILMDEFRRSGMSAAAFAGRVGVSTPTVYHWKRRLEQNHGSSAFGAQVPSPMVRVIPSAGSATVFPAPPGGDAGISIVSSSGFACRVERDFDAETLARVLQLLSD